MKSPKNNSSSKRDKEYAFLSPPPLERAIIVSFIIILSFSFLIWAIFNHQKYGFWCMAAAFCSFLLFTSICLRFIPKWIHFWSNSEFQSSKKPLKPIAQLCVKNTTFYIFCFSLICDITVLILTFIIRYHLGLASNFIDDLSFWRCTDSQHYLNIATDWYFTTGNIDRVVELVFLPGYPIVVRLVAYLTGNYLIAGLLVSALCFSAANCVFYNLLLLDYSHSQAIQTIKYVYLLPGIFFFVSPLSESLFFLLSLSCIFCIRKGHWYIGCLIGCYAAFTRSLGIVILVPAFFEFIHYVKNGSTIFPRIKEIVMHLLTLLLIPLGFVAYCGINYTVSGVFFKFLEYQRSHWHQQLGLFFNTAAYQMKYAIESATSDPHTFFGLWLPNILAFFLSLIVINLSLSSLRPSYIAWFIAYFLISMGATWLLSAPRYMLGLPVIPMAVMAMCKNKCLDKIISLTLLIVSFAYLYAFIMRWQVW